MAEIDDVVNWYPKQVVDWFRGLDDGLQSYIPNLEEANITGAQLLTLNYEDLENMGVSAVGHQVLILEAAELLRQLHYNLESENLQSRALDLNCRCRALRSHIISQTPSDVNPADAFRQGSSIPLLRLACDVLDSSKLLVMWLDRPPFSANNELRKVRTDIVRLSYELSTTVQQTIFACAIEDAVLSICGDMEKLSNLMVASNDVMTIQPAFLEVTHLVNRDPSSGLGLFIKATFEGHHVITGTKEGSISSRIRRITHGDEVVAVGGRNVVGWQLSKLVAALKESPNDISITLKKRPQFATNANTLPPLSRRNAKQGRILTAPPIVQPIQKVIESRKNSAADSVESNLDKTNSSKESLESPKKDSKKKKKFKKEKAKSSSNILGTQTNSLKKASMEHRGSLSLASTLEGKLRSSSSMEAILSTSSSNLTKNFDLRRSLEKVWKKESTQNRSRSEGKIKHKRTDSSSKNKKSKHGVAQQNMMPNVNDMLDELRQKRMKKSSSVSHESKSRSSKPDHHRIASEPAERPQSPLEFLAIPPPPNVPYTPRVENVLQGPNQKVTQHGRHKAVEKIPESPNSILDIEHRRRFTIIGSEQMDEKWYNSLLSEVNAKREKMKASHSSRQVLERLDETVTASEDSVFTSQSLVAEEIAVMKRAPKPKSRNRPMSMPPNYYSAAQLNQYRIGLALGALKSNGSSSKMSDTSFGSTASPIPHQIDANGVKKLAPLNCSTENVNLNRSGGSSLDKRSASARTNINNNNQSSERFKYRTPPQPAPRNTSPSVGSSSALPKQQKPQSMKASDRNSPRDPRNMLQGNQIPVKRGGSPSPDLVVPPYNSNKRPDSSGSPQQAAIADELGKIFARKSRTSAPSTSSDVFSPSPFVSPAWTDNNTFLPRSPAMGTNMVRQQNFSPLMPPVAKPRSRIKSPPVKDKIPPKTALVPNRKPNIDNKARHERVKSFDSAEIIGVSSSSKKQRRKSEGNNNDNKVNLDNSLPQNLAQAPPFSRGSYVAAIDGGFSLDDKKGNSKTGIQIDSEGYAIKVIDGVKVKLRKSPALVRSNSNSGKKGRLKIVDQLRASPEMRSHRRVSCRDLGAGECDGWLWKKKTNTTSPLSSKWSKRWVVLKENALYCYHTGEDDKAESYIYLPGYKVTPAPECKRRFAFRVAHPQRKTFYFASERQMDMSRWMNKLGLAAIEYAFQDKDNHKPKEENYFSESDSGTSNTSQSGADSSPATPNSSPEKALKNNQKPVTTTAPPPRKNGARHMSTLPDLNRSARYPKNKAEQLKSSAPYRDSSPSRNRSKSEGVSQKPLPSKPNAVKPSDSASSISAQDVAKASESNRNNSPSASPRSRPPASPVNRKRRTSDTRRKQYDSGSLTNLDTITDEGNPSHNEELRHARDIAAKKAEELAKRESRSSCSPSPSLESLPGESAKLGDQDSKVNSNHSSPRVIRRDVAGRPKVRAEESFRTDESQAGKPAKEGSIDDLCKALQNADVDIHGVNRKATLRRKMTILSRDPKTNELMLRKRTLQSQIKALESELAYYKLLDDKVITSEMLHDWINEHPSNFAELGTIRRMSKKRKNVAKPDDATAVAEDDKKESSMDPADNSSSAVSSPRTPTLSEFVSQKETLSTANDDRKLSDSGIEPTLSPVMTVPPVEPHARPRSWAVSGADAGKKRSKPSASSLEKSVSSVSPNSRSYLETDL